MIHFLPRDGIDAIEKRQIDRLASAICLPIWRSKTNAHKTARETKTILARSMVQYLAETKMRAQPGAPT